MHCPNCGNPVVVKGKFCPFCGSAIPEDLCIKIDMKQEVLDNGRIAEAEAKKKYEEEKTERYSVKLCIIGTIIMMIIIFAYLIVRQFNR